MKDDRRIRQLMNEVNGISLNLSAINQSTDNVEIACNAISVSLRKLLFDKKAGAILKRCFENKILLHPVKIVEPGQEMISGLNVGPGTIEITKVDTNETSNFSIPSFKIEVYPLPGFSINKETGSITMHEPFEMSAQPISLDRWLLQKIVRINDRDMTLLDVFKTIADEEGAHSKDDSKVNEKSKIYFARIFTFGDLSYFNWVVLFSASYLIRRIFDFDFVVEAAGDKRNDLSFLPAITFSSESKIPIPLEIEGSDVFSIKPPAPLSPRTSE